MAVLSVDSFEQLYFNGYRDHMLALEGGLPVLAPPTTEYGIIAIFVPSAIDNEVTASNQDTAGTKGNDNQVAVDVLMLPEAAPIKKSNVKLSHEETREQVLRDRCLEGDAIQSDQVVTSIQDHHITIDPSYPPHGDPLIFGLDDHTPDLPGSIRATKGTKAARQQDLKQLTVRKDMMLAGSRHGHKDQAYSNLRCKLRLYSDDAYLPQISCTFHVSYRDVAGMNESQAVTITFQQHNVVDKDVPLTYVQLNPSKKEDVQVVAQLLKRSEEDTVEFMNGFAVGHLIIRGKPDSAYGSNLYSDDTMYGPYLDKFQRLRGILQRDHTLHLLVRRPVNMDTLVQGWLSAFHNHTHRWAGPFNPYLVKEGSSQVIFQEGMPELDDIPQCAIPARISYSSPQEMYACEYWGAKAEYLAKVDVSVADKNVKADELIVPVFKALREVMHAEMSRDRHHRSATSELLLNVRHDRLQHLNFFANVSEAHLTDFHAALDQQGNQHTIVRYLQSLPMGCGIVDGVAGSGKTWLTLQLLLCHFAQHVEDRSFKFRALVTSPLNRNINAHADAIYESLCEVDQDVVVVRLNAGDLYRKVTKPPGLQTLNQGQTPVHGAVDKMVRMQLYNTLDDMTAALKAYELHESVNASEPHIRDRRITANAIGLSVGSWLLRFMGHIEDRSCLPEFHLLRSLYEEWTESSRPDQSLLHDLGVAIYIGIASVLQKAHVVATTLNLATEARAYCNILPTVVLLDEAGKATSIETLALFSLYAGSRFKLFFMDHWQLRPVVQSSTRTNPFERQMEVSTLPRLLAGGFPGLVLSYQMRYPESVCEVISDMFYSGMLHTSPSFVQQQPEIVNAITSAFGVKKSIFLVRVTKTEESVAAPCFSRTNKGTADIVFKIIEKIQRACEPLGGMDMRQVQVITGYFAQQEVFQNTCARLASMQPRDTPVNKRWSSARFETIDAAQGSQSLVNILEVTNTKSPGHMNECKRLATALSRTAGVQIIVMDVNALAKNDNGQFEGKPLHQLYVHLYQEKLVVNLPFDCRIDESMDVRAQWPSQPVAEVVAGWDNSILW